MRLDLPKDLLLTPNVNHNKQHFFVCSQRRRHIWQDVSSSHDASIHMKREGLWALMYVNLWYFLAFGQAFAQ